MTKFYYEIENDPLAQPRVYDSSNLTACKARARRMSERLDDLVYILAFRPGEEKPCGHIAYASGFKDGVEGEVA